MKHMLTSNNAVATLLYLLAFGGFAAPIFFAACSGGEADLRSADGGTKSRPTTSGPLPALTSPPPISTPAVGSTPVPTPPFAPLPWGKPEWDNVLRAAIAANSEDLMKATDMTVFCGKYNSLPISAKENAWAHLFVAMAKFESNWNPTTKYLEPPPLNYYSGGLLQLSVPECGLTETTLYQVAPNLKCGLSIMASQVRKTGLVVLPNTNKIRYWSCITSGNKYQKIGASAGMVSQAEGCK